MNMRASRRGLSPLLAIIIGLVVTVVAGILLAQLYFSYAATISKRPAANVEYVDLVKSDDTGILVVNIKNMGNVEIKDISISGPDLNAIEDCITTTTETTVPPGGTGSISCPVTLSDSTWSGYVQVTFADGSAQMYAISARARST
jgi:uncharacterized membrane protein